MSQHFRQEHIEQTRRYFLGLGASGVAAMGLLPAYLIGNPRSAQAAAGALPALDKLPKELHKAVKELEYLTKQEDFTDVSRGKPVPHSLPDEKKKEVGLTPDTWKVQVLSDPQHKADIANPMSKANDNAFDWAGLMKLAKKHTVSFPKIMTCNNIATPLGTGIWEGVPLRELLWLAKPKKNIRRVYYHGYHNDDPKQMFRSSLPIGRVLEEPFGLPPILLCFKLNGHLLAPKRGGPVRIVVPEAYGFKSVKWITHIYLSNKFAANDTYAGGNNDIDSWLKTFAAFISVPGKVKPGQAFAITGYSQVGIGGLSKVQYWIRKKPKAPATKPAGDPYFTKAPWKDAQILGPPTDWAGDLPDNKIPSHTMGFDPKTQQPLKWPIRLAKAHWASLAPGLPAGTYELRCRSIDAKGVAQPLPRPFRKSGRNAIQVEEMIVGE
jgi:DMSO/TMAO reductase YedYZ molybdopterin-dependent catalytic subunit